MGRRKKKSFNQLVEENKKMITNNRYALDEIDLKIEKKNDKKLKIFQEVLNESVQ